MIDSQRATQLTELMERFHVDALLCQLPQHVVMLTGYQPILGNIFCIITRNRMGAFEVRVAVPADEADRVPADLAIARATYTEETLEQITDMKQVAREPLAHLLADAGLSGHMTIGCEGGHAPVATAYTQVSIPGAASMTLLQALLPAAQITDATPLLTVLAAFKTDADLAHIARVEQVALAGFAAARDAVKIGATEAAIAAAATSGLLTAGYAVAGARQVQPFVHVMSGPRAALAYRAYNLTSQRSIERGDPVLVQMEVGIDGYWVELTRTFFVGAISATWRHAHDACVAAQDAALQVIRAGATGHMADHAARQVMEDAGFGAAFKHGLGHGFGFQAINHSAQPVLHPASSTMLREGMVHNMEPAVYLDGQGGLRLNDNVVVHADGNVVLSSALPRDLDWLVVT